MRLQDIVNEAGLIKTAKDLAVGAVRDIKTGYDAAGKPFQTLKSKMSSGQRSQKKATPFDNVDPREFKQILSAILNKQELSSRQRQVVKNLYNNL